MMFINWQVVGVWRSKAAYIKKGRNKGVTDATELGRSCDQRKRLPVPVCATLLVRRALMIDGTRYVRQSQQINDRGAPLRKYCFYRLAPLLNLESGAARRKLQLVVQDNSNGLAALPPH